MTAGPGFLPCPTPQLQSLQLILCEGRGSQNDSGYKPFRQYPQSILPHVLKENTRDHFWKKKTQRYIYIPWKSEKLQE